VNLEKECFVSLGPVDYHMCADSYSNLYGDAGISSDNIVNTIQTLI
jgi:hypothetical protein